MFTITCVRKSLIIYDNLFRAYNYIIPTNIFEFNAYSTNICNNHKWRTSTCRYRLSCLCNRPPPISTSSRPRRATSTWPRRRRTSTCSRPRWPPNRRPRKNLRIRSSTRSSTSGTHSSRNSCSKTTMNDRPCSTSTWLCRRTSLFNVWTVWIPNTVATTVTRFKRLTITPTKSNSRVW